MTKVSKLSVRPSLLLRMAQATVMSIMVGTFLVGCADNDIAEERRVVSPPDLSKASKFLSFAPDSGGVGTQLVIKGENLGTDTAYLRVTVNGKRANIVGVNNDHIYAIVPARADNGLVKVFVGKNRVWAFVPMACFLRPRSVDLGHCCATKTMPFLRWTKAVVPTKMVPCAACMRAMLKH